jgi:thiol-disulfide isomerase/thioredoxin
MPVATRNRMFFLSLILCVFTSCDRTVVDDKSAAVHQESADARGQAEGLPQQLTSRQVDSESLSSVVNETVDSEFETSQKLTDSYAATKGSPDSQPLLEQRLPAIKPVRSDDPAQMILHLEEIDRAIRDLLVTAKQMEQQTWRTAAIQLSRMKLEAAQHLTQISQASSEQSKLGLKAQLVALSHLSGLKDVQSARQLEELAKQLAQHVDSDLKHQSQIVLFGFAIQNLQNGVTSDASQLLESAKQLLVEPEFRSRLEMTSISHANSVLHQMGFASEAKELEELAFRAFSGSDDRELRYEAWNQWTQDSRSVENFLSSLQALKNSPDQSQPVLAAARGLYQEHPNAVTLEMIAGVIPDTEYAGHLGLSQELANFVNSELAQYSGSVSLEAIQATLSEHGQRVGWLDRKLELSGLVDENGASLDLSAYVGKVVFIDFWATWCPPCLKEIPNIRQVHQELTEKGFSVLSINMDKDQKRLEQFLQDQRFPWPTYRPASIDTKSLTDQFGITLFPHTMLMNQDGKIVSLHVHGPALKAQVLNLLQSSP